MEIVEAFLMEYGTTFAMMVLTGLCIALFVEFTIKKSMAWLERKLEGKDKALSVLSVVKACITQIAVWTLCIWFLDLLVGNLPFPGSAALFPIWLCLEYVIQYVFSCVGFKGLQAWYSSRRAKKEEPREVLTPTSVKGIYKDSIGNLVNAKGVPVEVV